MYQVIHGFVLTSGQVIVAEDFFADSVHYAYIISKTSPSAGCIAATHSRASSTALWSLRIELRQW
jgi:hypothetical protein